jgi:kumamolisin
MKQPRKLSRPNVLLVVAAVTAAVIASTTNASAATRSAATQRVALASADPGQALASASDVGPADDTTPMQVSFILRLRQSVALQAQVQTGWARPFLTTAQFAASYGQPRSVIAAIENYLAGFGIQSSAYADNLDISAVGTVGEFSQALKVREHNFRVHEPDQFGLGTHLATVYGPTNGPTLPGALGSAVLAVLGLSNYNATSSDLRRAPVPDGTTSSSGFAHTPRDFADRYGLTPLLNSGATGQGRTIGIITFASFDPSGAYTFWNDILGLNVPHGRISIEQIDGGSGPFPSEGTLETDLDVEESGAVAPGAHLKIYESGPGATGFVDPFFAAASENVADSVTVSFGNSETVLKYLIAVGLLPSTYLGVLDEAYLEMAAQGQTAFAAAGDNGAYQAQADLQTTNLDTNFPSDSPYVTSAGGTTLPGTITFTQTDFNGNPIGNPESAVIPAERAWSSDYEWPLYRTIGYPSEAAMATDYLNANDLGGGGGFSTLEARPIYQAPIARYQARPFLTPTEYANTPAGLVVPISYSFNPAPPLVAGLSTTGRGQPDLATDADGWTGYEVYDADFGLIIGVGGTSVVAPQLAGSAAVIDSADGGRTGFWNPAMYRAAFLRLGSPFTPLNSTTVYSGVNYLYETDSTGHRTALPGEFTNDNLYYTGTPAAAWNPATGLGTPNLAKLARVVRH